LRELLIRLRASDPRILIVCRWLVFLGALLLLWKTGSPIVTMGALWINIAFSSLIVTGLDNTDVAKPMRHFDKRVGDFSYPIYLLHMQIGVVASVLLFGARMPRLRSVEGVAILALTLVLTGLLAVACARVIDPAIERQRTRIRQHATAASAA
jgi:peptidoglycan/LPS O-acetylase OafA/YrhL